MQFATLFLIASAVLAMPTGSASGNNAVAGLAKKADGFVFPDDDEPTVYVPKEGVKVPEAGRMIFPDEFKNNYIPKPKTNSNGNCNSNSNKNQGQVAPSPVASSAAPVASSASPVASSAAPVASSAAPVASSAASSASAGPVKHRYENQRDKSGNDCPLFKQILTIEEVPEECLKPSFCSLSYSTFRKACDKVDLRGETVNKEELIQKVTNLECVREAICRREDLYFPNSDQELNF